MQIVNCHKGTQQLDRNNIDNKIVTNWGQSSAHESAPAADDWGPLVPPVTKGISITIVRCGGGGDTLVIYVL